MRTLRILSTVACALVCVALVTATTQAAPRRHSSPAHRSGKVHATATHRTRVAAKPIAHMPGSAGMVVAVDPSTGELGMPTPEQMQALYTTPGDDLNESDAGLTPVYHANGTISLDLQGRFQDYSVVRIGPDGKLIFGCGKSVAGAMGETFTPSRAPSVLEDK